MKKILLILSILFIVGISASQASLLSLNAMSAININSGYNDQIEFTASDQYIVYTEYADNNFSLYLYSISSGESKLLVEKNEDRFRPSIDSKDIVWTIAKNGKKYINHYNIDTEENSVYAMSSNYHDTNPFIQNSSITFTRWNLRNGDSTIMLYNINDGTLKTVDGEVNSKQTNQRHYNNTIVWQDQRNGIDEIFIKQIIDDKEEVSNLSNNGLNHYFPKISGDNVIWDTKNAVYAKNLTDKSLQVIGSNSYANFYSSIEGNNVVYQSKRNGSYDIYLYNLKTKSETKLTNSYQNDESPSIKGNVVTWRRQNNNGRYDVHYMSIKPALEELYTKLNFKPTTSLEVKISWPNHEDGNYVSARLYRSNTSSIKGDIIKNNLITNNYLDTNLAANKNYYYTLTLIDVNGYESNSSEQFKYTPNSQQLVKLSNSSTVYLVDQDSYYMISSEDIFNAHDYKWSDIHTITQRELDSHHYNGPLKYPTGTLLHAYDNSVYLVYEDNIRPFASEEVFLRAGYKWSQVKQISQTMFNIYNIGEELTIDNFIHPNNTLIKYTYNPDVYLIENNTKRLITDEASFIQHGYQWNKVMTIPVYWEYPTGPNL